MYVCLEGCGYSELFFCRYDESARTHRLGVLDCSAYLMSMSGENTAVLLVNYYEFY